LRRDRIRLPVLIALAVGFVGGSAPAIVETFGGSKEEILSYISSAVPSVVGRIFQGAVQGPNVGSVLIAEVFLFGLFIIAIMSIFVVSRHTRHNEETGAGELISSGIVGRSAPLTAALLVAVLANAVVGLLIFGILVSVPEFNNGSSAYFAAAMAAFGILMASVSAVTAQLSDYRRGANLMAISVLGVFFVIRALGDSLGKIGADGLSVTSSWISWLSPMGWSYLVLPFAADRLFPIVMLLGLSAALSGFAYYLMSKRDIGSSIFNSKPGPARASSHLLGTMGLTHRLQKGNLTAWLVGYGVAGVLIAVVVNDFRATFEDSDVFADFITTSGNGNFMQSVIATMFPLLAAMLSAYVITAISKMQDEESSGRIEYLLGTALDKTKWMLSHVGYTLMGIVATLAVMGVAGAIAYNLATDSTTSLSGIEIGLSALASVPAMTLFMTVIVFVFALRSRFVKAFGWGFYVYCTLISSLNQIFAWPTWTSYLSPFYHTPQYPGATFDWLPIIVMSVSAVIVLIVSVAMFNRRDISLK
jgi:ABC-2 type transport system permease protein